MPRSGALVEGGNLVKTHGMTHIALAVQDAERSLRFYQAVFGVVPVYRSPGSIQAQTPGSRDVLVFEEGRARVGTAGGIVHFGFSSSVILPRWKASSYLASKKAQEASNSRRLASPS